MQYASAAVGIAGALTPAAAHASTIVAGNPLSFDASFCSGPRFQSEAWDIVPGTRAFIVAASGTGNCGSRRGRIASAQGSLHRASVAGGIVGPVALGYMVGAGDNFASGAGGAGAFFFSKGMGTYSGGTGGSWANKSGDIGLRFTLNGQTHYGWGVLEVSVSPWGYSADVTNVYYNSMAGQPITVGQTQTTPEPGTLDLLALGSLGLGFWRRKKAT